MTDSLRTSRELIGTREAARILGVSQGRIRQLVLPRGKAKPILWSAHLGVNTIVVDKAEVLAYAEGLFARRAAGKARGTAPQGFKPG